ncbi:MAG: DNA mismatch repair protein MutS, partial [Clostridia bacterium]|nr:DNA mismatch repair protein MutS [Clostridia bacterium]
MSKKGENDRGLSDMMIHYRSIKEQYNDCIVFYRLGDFYEMFEDDAIEASKLLELTLTGRDCGLEKRAPMCGVPYHAADGYIAKLVNLGKKVAICEQLSDPATSKGLVTRDVVRIVTGGTVTEDKFVDEKSNNFILAVSKKNKVYSIAWADITTGEFFCQLALSKTDALDVLFRVNPAQIICDGEFFDEYTLFPEPVKNALKYPELYKDKAFDRKTAAKTVCDHFSVKSEDDVISPDSSAALCAAGAILTYLAETQRHVIKNVKSLNYYDDKKYMKLDTTALRNLEITSSIRGGKFGSLLYAIDHTVTAGGGRRIKAMVLTPLRDKAAINRRLDGVAELYSDNLRRESITETLKNVKDLARLCGRISNGIVSPRDCEYIKNTLSCAPVIKMQLSGMTSDILCGIRDAMGDFAELEKTIGLIIKDNAPVSYKEGNFVNDGFDEELDRYRKKDRNGRAELDEYETSERNATGIKT